MTIKFYKSKDWKKAGTLAYFLADLDSKGTNRSTGEPYLESYAPIGQHSEVAPDYLRCNSIEISKAEYIEATKGIYTPEEYLQ